MIDQAVHSTDPEDFYYIDINIPCQSACPAQTNIPAYIRCLFEGRYGRSYEINRAVNILPGVLGRICSRPCEDKCRHGESELGHPVNICHIKRAAADVRIDDKGQEGLILPATGKKVAIIGSGPAGLSAAHDLVTIGISATIFEALDKPGGMLKYGIPEFRLPRNILQNEIDYILGLGAILKTGIRVGSDISIQELLADYDAVLLAAGCYEPNTLNVPGETLEGVHSGLNFMMDFCSGRDLTVGNRVLVIGAGFTAFDCARSALRLGAKEVAICLRRTEADLTVTDAEIRETKIEGIKINSLMLARKIHGSQRAEGVKFVRTRPNELREDGKREITPIEGSEFFMPADTVVVATGQRPQPIKAPGRKNESGHLTADRDTFRSLEERLYVTGDYLTGPSTVIDAIALGREAAEKIAEDLTGRKFRYRSVRMEETQITDRQRSWDFIPRQEIPTVQRAADRFKEPNTEVETGFSKDQANEESKRCYLCHQHYEIDISRCIYCRYCIDVAPRDCIKLVDEIKTNEIGAITEFVETTVWNKVNAVVIDNSRCIRCGECVRVCPVDCISVTKVELVEQILKEEEPRV